MTRGTVRAVLSRRIELKESIVCQRHPYLSAAVKVQPTDAFPLVALCTDVAGGRTFCRLGDALRRQHSLPVYGS